MRRSCCARPKPRGIVFGPANGWLTFVPYAGLAAYRSAGEAAFCGLSFEAALAFAVLHYCYAEDHGWSFALADSVRPLVQFACWWDQHTGRRARPVRSACLSPPLSQRRHSSRCFVRSTMKRQRDETRRSVRSSCSDFPRIRWLSPDLAQDHTQDLLDRAGRKLGAKPASAAVRFQLPPNRKIAFPEPAPTAREALTSSSPFMAQFKPPWSLTMVTTWGFRRARRSWRLEGVVALR